MHLNVTLVLRCVTCFRLKATGANYEENATQMWLRKGANNTCIKQCRQKVIQAVFLPSIQLPYTSCISMPDKLHTPLKDSYTSKRNVKYEKQLEIHQKGRHFRICIWRKMYYSQPLHIIGLFYTPIISLMFLSISNFKHCSILLISHYWPPLRRVAMALWNKPFPSTQPQQPLLCLV